MGYNNPSHHHYQSSWTSSLENQFPGSTSGSSIGGTEAMLDEGKTMDYSVATAPTHFSNGGGEAHAATAEYEDDTTTIRSLDSITGASLLHLTDDDDDLLHSSSRTLIMSGGHLTMRETQASTSAPMHHLGAGAGGATSSVCSASTAPSTDEASSIGPDWTQYSSDTNSRLMQPQATYQQHHQHRRVPSWDISSPSNQFASPSGRTSPSSLNLPPTFSPSGWSSAGQQHAQLHVASFRGEPGQNVGYAQGSRLNPNGGQWNQPNLPFLPQSVGRSAQDGSRGMMHRPNNNTPYPYSAHHQQPRKVHSQPPLPPSTMHTPPRGGLNDRGPRLVGPSQPSHRPPQNQSSAHVIGGGARSSSEVLKTLLRKKACLYESDTSRAVALVTWLVGRELASEYGFFSRQQLQAGVHACVDDKINSGVITRTKVNRCMQIILNSCFHYIIPRSDGSEENGESFRRLFAKEMKDNRFLLSVLPPPWNDLRINRAEILAACEEDDHDHKSHKKFTFDTPCASPRLGSVNERVPSSPSRDSVDGDNSECKRAVLLCFNENVRCAEDVFRCHNEFIRDTAHACHLQLSSSEWRLFFGREAAGAPYLWGNIGIPVPYLEGQGHQQADALGVLSKEELGVFRTSWCSKRYDHDHELCGFGHAEINGGWLRRSTFIHNYSDEMCHFVSTVPASNRPDSRNVIVINDCPHGVKCTSAHSLEEITYHQRRYKQRACTSIGRPGGCHLGDVCPCFHPVESYRFPKKSDGRSPRHARNGQGQLNNSGKGNAPIVQPTGSPILYANPAPLSSFEQHLLLPGLQSLFRRQSSVMRANLPSSKSKTICYYSYFEPSPSSPSPNHQSKSIGPSQQLRI